MARIQWLIVLVATTFALATTYSLVVPAWEAPDEDAHYRFIQYLRQHGNLPVQGEAGIAAHHAPLYYVLAAFATLPVDTTDFVQWSFQGNRAFIWHGQGKDLNYVVHGEGEGFPYSSQARFLHLARLVSVFMATATVAAIVLSGWQIFPERPSVGLLAGALTAFNPQFLFVGGAINNDNLITLAATGLLLQMLRALPRLQDVRPWIWFGLWIGVAAMAKISGLVFLAVAGILLLVDSLWRRNWRLFWLRGMALIAPVVLATGWWFVRNVLIYGDVMGWNKFMAIYAGTARITELSLEEYGRFFRIQFGSYWAAFGWTTVYPPYWFYLAIAALCTAALLGLLLFFMSDYRILPRTVQAGLLLCVLMIVVYESYMLVTISQFDPSFYQGRYLFPLAGPLAILASVGLHRLAPPHRAHLLVAGAALALLVMALYMPFFVIRPAYGL